MCYPVKTDTGLLRKPAMIVLILFTATLSQGCLKDLRRTSVERTTDDSAVTEHIEQDAGEEFIAAEEVLPEEDLVIQETLEHVIRYTGENLALISQWYTGRSANWPAILEANPGTVPTALRLGQVILIPKHLVIRDEPMPQSYVRPPSAGPSRSKEPPEQASDSDSEIQEPPGPTQAPTEKEVTPQATGTEQELPDLLIAPTR